MLATRVCGKVEMQKRQTKCQKTAIEKCRIWQTGFHNFLQHLPGAEKRKSIADILLIIVPSLCLARQI